MQSADCAGAIFYSMMKLASDSSHNTTGELYKIVTSVVDKWRKLLQFYLPGKDEEILHLLYDKDVLSEEAIQDWETEKADAEESDRCFVKQAEKFLQWLREA